MWQLNLCDDELTRKCYQMTRTLLRVRKKCRLHSEADASRWVRFEDALTLLLRRTSPGEQETPRGEKNFLQTEISVTGDHRSFETFTGGGLDFSSLQISSSPLNSPYLVRNSL